VKGTFALGEDGGADAEPAPAEAQEPVALADIGNDGAAATASPRYEADTSWPKPATDVVLVGHAHAPSGGATRVDVALQAGPVRKVVAVFGDRRWHLGAGGWRISAPLPFERIPLVYERAFGGQDDSPADPGRRGWEPRNPAGTGFVAMEDVRRLEGLALPNLEDPDALISSWKDRPRPAGFGFLGRGWQPRLGFTGTYDQQWQDNRAPLLPTDFDPRFWNAAHPDLVVAGRLRGGEPVAVLNASPRGRLGFVLPRRAFEVHAEVKGRRQSAEPLLDTVWIDADRQLVVLVWRAALRCPRSFLQIDTVLVKERR
jgi:hypothetical protein